ncbi:hypothetical protein [Microtetraspora sp. NBRC 16547]|uniref:hypothetical protein n=1 Tax=Microtetraspora sp. NBRC 16547 TaxID=3030993 RepID=UPI0024A28949|nr:hypothetical protein [Microtetraspora sp. NBRC 16547]GLW96223.1 hypothetical protein Misp02_03100 [Microtetraspora sp. NBRC 16547]
MARDPEKRPGQTHRTDWLALLCGLLFVGVGIRYLIPPSPDPALILLILIVGLGFSAFVAILAKAARKH